MNTKTPLQRMSIYTAWIIVIFSLAFGIFAASVTWKWWSGTNDHYSLPDESVLDQLPDGFSTHSALRLFDSHESSQRIATYSVVNTPVSTAQAIPMLTRTYEQHGWTASKGQLTKDGCISFADKDSFVAIYASNPMNPHNQERVDWANRSAVDPEHQLIVSLVTC